MVPFLCSTDNVNTINETLESFIVNIFVLDLNIETCANYHCDQHCVKMVTEYAQMLSTALRTWGIQKGFKATHENHPCTKWTRLTLQNYQWLWLLTDSLGKEYTKRYDRLHKSHDMLLNDIPFHPNLKKNIERLLMLPGRTKFANCTPYDLPNVIKAYRKFYINDKSRFARWKHSEIPKWYTRGII